MSTGPYPYREEFHMKNHTHAALLASLVGMLAVAPAMHALAAPGEANTAFEFASGWPLTTRLTRRPAR